MAREFGRNARIASQMQKELALLLQRDVKDPRLGFVTVNEVEVSKDLSVAKVFVTVMNADSKTVARNLEILNEAAAYLRREVGKRIRMRSVPELRFYYDESLDSGMRMDAILQELEAYPSGKEQE
ncbi:MAG: 30S ribosome-binding factor RbfA [Gammaproteobacteria bacterium]